MSKPRMVYFEKEDILHYSISDEPEAGSVEVTPNITAELNAKGELIGIEIEFFNEKPLKRFSKRPERRGHRVKTRC